MKSRREVHIRVQTDDIFCSPAAGSRAAGFCQPARWPFTQSSARLHGVGPLLILACLFSLLACTHTPAKPASRSLLPEKVPFLQELVQNLNSAKNQPRLVKASLSMEVRDGPHGPLRSCRGHMLLSAHKELYLRGDRPLLPTLFTLVSNGKDFWLSVPRNNTVYTGPLDAVAGKNEQYGVGLNLGDLFRALLPCPIGNDLLVELEAAGPLYLLTVFEVAGTAKKLHRRLWVANRPYRVQNERYYNAVGAEELEILRDDFLESSGCLYPRKILLRSSAGSVVTMNFHEVRMNPERPRQDPFHFEIPSGAAVKIIQ